MCCVAMLHMHSLYLCCVSCIYCFPVELICKELLLEQIIVDIIEKTLLIKRVLFLLQLCLKLQKSERRLLGWVACCGRPVDTKHRSSATAPCRCSRRAGRRDQNSAEEDRRSGPKPPQTPADPTSCSAQIDAAGELMSW